MEIYQNTRTHTHKTVGHAIDAYTRQHKRQLANGFDAKMFRFLLLRRIFSNIQLIYNLRDCLDVLVINMGSEFVTRLAQQAYLIRL